MTKQEFDMLTQQYYQNRVPNYQLNTPSLTAPTSLNYDASQNIMGNTPSTTPSTEIDPWSIGMAAGQAMAPLGASILGRRREFPRGGNDSVSLGMTRGAEVPNAYAGRTNPVISALLARYLGRR